MSDSLLRYVPSPLDAIEGWSVSPDAVAYDKEGIQEKLLSLDEPCFAVRGEGRIGLCTQARWEGPGRHPGGSVEVLAWASPLPMGRLGDVGFQEAHGTAYSYYAGAMAMGIASESMVIALGRAGFMGSFGAAGLLPSRVGEAISRIRQGLPNGPFAFNLIYSPDDPKLEQECVNLYLREGVRCVEAAAYLDLSPHLVRYRVLGLGLDAQGRPEIRNRIIAKLSRKEVATKFLEPPPGRILKQLREQGLITERQAELSQRVPMADDITVEADSGGHTDNRPLVALLPSIIALRDELQARHGYERPVRIGAGGGIGTPAAALAAFVMGADYVVTGSINQSCIESGTSDHVKKLLGEADMADVIMVPAADMFEMGVKMQVLKRGTLFPMRAQKLYELYQRYGSIGEIPATERDNLEKKVFRNSLDSIWESTKSYFSGRDPVRIERAARNPKEKMALVFRWYLGLSSHWAVAGEHGREMDYQVWCGPSMGSFNAWLRDSYLEDVSNRKVVDVALHILRGAAFSFRVQGLRNQGIRFPPSLAAYNPRLLTP